MFFILDDIEESKIYFTYFQFFIMQRRINHLFTSQPIAVAALL